MTTPAGPLFGGPPVPPPPNPRSRRCAGCGHRRGDRRDYMRHTPMHCRQCVLLRLKSGDASISCTAYKEVKEEAPAP